MKGLINACEFARINELSTRKLIQPIIHNNQKLKEENSKSTSTEPS